MPVIVPDFSFLFVQEENKKLCSVVPAVKTTKSNTSVQSANTCGKLDSSHESNLNKMSKVKVRRKKQTLSLVQLVIEVGLFDQFLLMNIRSTVIG